MANKKHSGFRTWTDFLDTQPCFEVEGIETHSAVGAGVTSHHFLSPNVYVDWIGHHSQPPPGLGIAGAQLAIIEKDARGILDRAGLLKDSEEDYTLPAKRGPWARLLEVMASREYLDKEWYAARILTQTSLLRELIADFTESAEAPKRKKTKNSKAWELEVIKAIKKQGASPEMITMIQTKPATSGIQEIIISAMMLGGQLTEAHIRFGPVRGNSKDGGDARGLQQTDTQKKEWAKWQEEAEKVWKKRPKWGKPAVAKVVHEKFPDVPVETIRPRIKKPSP